MNTKAIAVICFAAALAPLVSPQPFMLTPEIFEPATTEARTRQMDNYTGFVFDFKNAASSDMTPNGMLQPNQVQTNPFLSTLPGDGNAQTLVTLGPCSGNTPHVHPRGSEISFLLYGAITFGMVEENAVNNTLVIRNITQNQTIHVPQGLIHFSFNYNCEPAAFLANFATKDPGTQTIWASMMMIPTNILNSATGIEEQTIDLIKAKYPLLTTPGTGGEECLKRCGINFATANKLTPLSQYNMTNTGVAG